MAQLNPEGALAARLARDASDFYRRRASAEYGPADATSRERYGQAYEGSGRKGQWFDNWGAFLGSADRDWIPERGGVVARARDLFRNDPIASSAIARRKNAAVGKGWRLSAKPDARALGVTREQARELGQQIETEWKQYAYGYNFQVDAERKLNFGQLLRVATSHLMLDGEFLGVVEWAADEPTRYKTRLRLVDPDRLSNPAGSIDTDTRRGGVELDPCSFAPVGYHIRRRHPFDLGVSSQAFTWDYWPRYSTPLGRPQVLHGFDPDRAAQHRGVSRFAAALKSFRSFSKFKDATVQAATIDALILGYVQSGAGPEAISENFAYEQYADYHNDREEHYRDHPVKLDDAVFPTLPHGDELKFATANKTTAGFDAFAKAIIRLIAASLGVTYEELSMDYSSTNYSSARAAMVHAWAETVAFMGVLEAQLVKPLYVAWLEEAIDAGRFPLLANNDNWPDFYEMPDAYAEGRWIGPPRGYIDPTKEILAAAARIEAGISTLEDECAEQGKFYMDVMEQGIFEEATDKQLRQEAGLDPVAEAAAMAQAIEDTKNPAKAAPDPSDDQGDPVQTPEDQRPAPGGQNKGALAAIARFADTADHAAFLDGRAVAA